MKRPALLLLPCLATFVAGAASMLASAADGAVVAQDLVKPRASYLVMAAIWARQPDSYTLKVVLDRAKHSAKQRAIVDANKERLASSPRAVATAPPSGGIDRGSLLRSDGTQILPEAYSCLPDPEAVEVMYTFSAADSRLAVAAAIRIEGDFYIEKLQSLEPEPLRRSQ
jgi:hypothetical protein